LPHRFGSAIFNPRQVTNLPYKGQSYIDVVCRAGWHPAAD
jgi:hypothetical protein